MYCCTCKERAVSGHGKVGAQNESAEKKMVVFPLRTMHVGPIRFHVLSVATM